MKGKRRDGRRRKREKRGRRRNHPRSGCRLEAPYPKPNIAKINSPNQAP